jgi:hypothetical protein
MNLSMWASLSSYLVQEPNFRELCINFVLVRDTLMPFNLFLYSSSLSLSHTRTSKHKHPHKYDDTVTLFFKRIIFWDVTPCSLLSCNRRFGGTYRLHLQGRSNNFSKNQQASTAVKTSNPIFSCKTCEDATDVFLMSQYSKIIQILTFLNKIRPEYEHTAESKKLMMTEERCVPSIWNDITSATRISSVLCECKTWSLTLREDHIYNVWEQSSEKDI